MKNVTFLTIAVVVLSSLACKKGNDSPNPTIVGTWKRTQKQTRTAINSAWQSATLDPCISDNTYKYEAGSTMSWDEGATKCDPIDSQTVSASYSFGGKGGKLSNSFGGFDFDVEDITETTLIIIEPRLANGSGDDIQWTLNKQ